MVKGNSRQVILVQPPDPKLFEQAIFILRDDAVARNGVTDDQLLKEANCILSSGDRHRGRTLPGPVWACAGAFLTGILWLLTAVF